MREVGYIAYIDEAGDDGIRYVNPADKTRKSASEWFVMGCAVVRLENNGLIVPWVDSTINDLKLRQRKSIHFAELRTHKRKTVCERLCKLPVRCFSAISHKPNMSGYKNDRASKVGTSVNRFYPWTARILMERVSDFCSRDSIARYGEPKLVRFYFARRGGIYLADLKDYLLTLEYKHHTTGNYLEKFMIDWRVMDIMQLHISDPVTNPGLQLSDIVAGAFYQALGDARLGLEPDPCFAQHLKPVMARCPANRYFEYGIKLMPSLKPLRNRPKEREIFEFYR